MPLIADDASPLDAGRLAFGKRLRTRSLWRLSS
jgi:hypothetical protein